MNEKIYDALWINATLAICQGDFSVIKHGALAVKEGRIAWVGRMQDLPRGIQVAQTYDVAGDLVTPGLVDCHTHVVFAGNRANEFELRLQGVSYQEILRQGGGIHATVAATRQASKESLLAQSIKRVQALMASGVTTLEIKSGYGLALATEIKMLKVAREIGELLGIEVIPTFLGAHTVAQEYKGRGQAYVEHICQEMLPAIRQQELAQAVDVFCETIAFDLQQTEQVFQCARNLGFSLKCHAEQLSASGAAQLAARYGALSVDHLEHLSVAGVQALAQAGCVAVLLPGAFYFLREQKLPPIASLREYGVPIALASDCNPGTSPVLSLLMIMNMGCVLFGLTVEEVMLGVTLHAARALGCEKNQGSLTVGKVADLAVWEVSEPRDLIYYLGNRPLRQLIKRGKLLTLPL